MEERLILAQKRFSHLLNSLPVGIAIVNAAGRIEAVSQGLISLFGYERGELLDKSLDVLIHKAPWKDAAVAPGDWMAGLPEQSIELQGVASDGDRIVIELSIRPLEEDVRGRYVVVVQDASERFKARMLRQEFFQMINHDIRSPLAGVAAFLDALKGSGRYGNISELGAERLDMALQNIGRINSLVSGFLELAGIEHGSSSQAPRLSNPLDFIASAMASVREQADARGVAIECHVQSLSVVVDYERIVQAIVNLLANALEHTPPGQPIEVTALKSSGQLRVAVRDHGPGVPDSDKAIIFERFSQGSAAADKKAGYGLGLAIARQIITQHGGTIACLDAEGGGSVFSFAIPLPDGDAT